MWEEEDNSSFVPHNAARTFKTMASPTTVMWMKQLYVPLQSSDSSSLDNILACLSGIKCWRSQNFLNSNDDKSEVIVFGQTDSTSPLHSMLGSLTKNISEKCCPVLHLSAQENLHCYILLIYIKSYTCFYFFSHLDYYNALYASISKTSLH